LSEDGHGESAEDRGGESGAKGHRGYLLKG